jgi:hypothetical protein
VEAWIEGAGWLSFDGSPRAEVTLVGGGWLALHLDALRMRWYRYVVNWSLKDQVDLASAIRHTARAWRPEWPALGAWEIARSPIVVSWVVIGAIVAWHLGRRGIVGRHRLRRRAVPEFYRRALRQLARRGIRPGRGETAREFSARVTAQAPAWGAPLDTLTLAYERVRFGATTLDPEDVAVVDASLSALRTP